MSHTAVEGPDRSGSLHGREGMGSERSRPKTGMQSTALIQLVSHAVRLGPIITGCQRVQRRVRGKVPLTFIVDVDLASPSLEGCYTEEGTASTATRHIPELDGVRNEVEVKL
nr:hypothetical protein CFP56_22106 [Quercus suber]